MREIVGVPAELLQRWSSRRAAIEARTAESKQFQATDDREPTNIEAIALAQQATPESREAKHEPRSMAEQRHTWPAEAIEALGGQRALTPMLGDVLSAGRRADRGRRKSVSVGGLPHEWRLAISVPGKTPTMVGRFDAQAETGRPGPDVVIFDPFRPAPGVVQSKE